MLNKNRHHWSWHNAFLNNVLHTAAEYTVVRFDKLFSKKHQLLQTFSLSNSNFISNLMEDDMNTNESSFNPVYKMTRKKVGQVVIFNNKLFDDGKRYTRKLLSVKPHLHGRLFCNAIRRFFMRENLSCKAVKPHLPGRLLAAIIDILPFFFLKSRRSLTRRKIHVWFCLRDIARHAPRKIKS